jgi:hypothetical protein
LEPEQEEQEQLQHQLKPREHPQRPQEDLPEVPEVFVPHPKFEPDPGFELQATAKIDLLD